MNKHLLSLVFIFLAASACSAFAGHIKRADNLPFPYLGRGCYEIEGKGGECGTSFPEHPLSYFLHPEDWAEPDVDPFEGRPGKVEKINEVGSLGHNRIVQIYYHGNYSSILAEIKPDQFLPLMKYSSFASALNAAVLQNFEGRQLLTVDQNYENSSNSMSFWAWVATSYGPAWLDFGSVIAKAKKDFAPRTACSMHPYDTMDWSQLHYEEGGCLDIWFELDGPQVLPESVAVSRCTMVVTSFEHGNGAEHENITYSPSKAACKQLNFRD